MARSIVSTLMQQKPPVAAPPEEQPHHHETTTILSKNEMLTPCNKACHSSKSILPNIFLWIVIILPWCKIMIDTISIRQWDHHMSLSSLGSSSSSSSSSLHMMNQLPSPKTKVQQQQQLSSNSVREQKRKPRQEQPNTSWNSIQYASGTLDDDNPIHKQIREQCEKQSGVYVGGSGFDKYCAGPILTNFSCCYCYDEFPMFLYDDPIRWSYHIQNIKQQTQEVESSPTIRYWFCAAPREQQLLHDKHANENDLIPFDNNHQNENNDKAFELFIVTGKWGFRNQFQNDVINFCIQVHEILSFLHGDHIHCYEHNIDSILQDVRFQRHLKYRNQPNDASKNGAGYWFHRYMMIQHQMTHPHGNDHDNHEIQANGLNLNNPNAILVWIDIDRLDFFRHGTFNALIYAMELRNADFLIESHHFIEYAWTKEDVFTAFHADESTRLSKQVNAGAFMVRNNAKMRVFIDAMIDCVADWHMLSEQPSYLPNNKTYFREHRYDQSILSLFVKTFLKNKTLIGPPAQAYAPPYSSFHTYLLPDHVTPYCPFESFYETYPQYRSKDRKTRGK